MQVYLKRREKWENIKNTWARGQAYLDEEYLETRDLAERVSNSNCRIQLEDILSELNGFYSIIHETDDRVLFAANHVRSWPIYYAHTDDIYVSDSINYLFKNASERGYNPIAATEYLFTSYVTGEETLIRDIKQVQAGELIEIRKNLSNPKITSHRYFKYTPGHNSNKTDIKEMDEIIKNVFDRFLNYVNGRTIVLGLSSGYDSRLILLMLYRLGYENVITYTHDTPSGDSDDVRIAKSIADDLGYKHIELTHTHSDYREFYDSERWKSFIDYVEFQSKFPSTQTMVTLEKLNNSARKVE